MSDAESTGAAVKPALVVQTTTIVVPTSHPAAIEPTANDDVAPTTGVNTAPAVAGRVGRRASRISGRVKRTRIGATANVECRARHSDAPTSPL